MAERIKEGGKSWVVFIVLIAVVMSILGLFLFRPWENANNLDNLESVDLTTMNSTMVFAYVNDMVNTRPEKYLGKTVKARGEYSRINSSGGEDKHYIIISDATACCAQGIEVRYEGEFPAEGSEILIQGSYDKYIEESKSVYFINVTTLSA